MLAPPRQRRRPWRLAARALILGFVLLNVAAFFHGWSMGRYAESLDHTPPPEELDLLTKARVLLLGAKLPRPKNHRAPTDFGMDYETLFFSGAFEVRLQAWHVARENGRGLVLLFHGHGAAKDSLLPAAEVFHQLGWDCALIDFHGSGGSGASRTSVGWHEAADVAAAYRHFSPRYHDRPIVLYGVSMGSAAVLRAIHELHVVPNGVVLELPFDRLVNAARTRFRAMHVPSWPAADLLVFYGGLCGGFNGFALKPEHFARSVTCPALVLNGELDPRAPPEQALAVFKNLSGPRTRRQFAGLGHRNFVEHAPETWRATIAAFLEQVEQPPVRRGPR